MKFLEVAHALNEGKEIYWNNHYIGNAYIVKEDNRYKYTENVCYDDYYESFDDLCNLLKHTEDWSIIVPLTETQMQIEKSILTAKCILDRIGNIEKEWLQRQALVGKLEGANKSISKAISILKQYGDDKW